MRCKRNNCAVGMLLAFLVASVLHVLHIKGFVMPTVHWRTMLNHGQLSEASNTQSPDVRQRTVLRHGEILAQRREVIKSTCDRIHIVSNRSQTVLGDVAANFAYCVVPKAGCTIWIRILKYLNGQKRDGKSPMAISKHEVHYADLDILQRLQVTAYNATFVRNSFRAMTVRNPYTRLWSAYIDKLFLPDFWSSKGKQIIRLMRRNPNRKSKDCGNDVTFPEFIGYVIRTGHSFQFVPQDKHWLPASDLCDPCLFDPAVLAKQETFIQDIEHVLHSIGLTKMMEHIKYVDPVEYEIQDEIDYNFKILRYHVNCINKYTLCKLMWSAFVINGYIPPEESFPANIMNIDSNVTPETFYDIIREVRRRNNVTRAVTKRLRVQALSMAYKQIPDRHIQQLQELYKADFDLFGYDNTPSA